MNSPGWMIPRQGIVFHERLDHGAPANRESVQRHSNPGQQMTPLLFVHAPQDIPDGRPSQHPPGPVQHALVSVPPADAIEGLADEDRPEVPQNALRIAAEDLRPRQPLNIVMVFRLMNVLQ